MFQVPGFQSFVIETFATNCCLYSVLDKSFEFRDAHTVSYLFADWKKFRLLVCEKCYFEFTNPWISFNSSLHDYDILVSLYT